MGVSASSLLDESRSTWIKGEVETALRRFTPYYRKQFSVCRFCLLEDELERNEHKFPRQREAPEEGQVLYEEGMLYFDDSRKWRERYMVVRANYCLEFHDNLESFIKGIPPHHKLLPTGGVVVTTEEKYMAMVDQCFPDDTNVKEDFAPPLSGMPGQFPVYLRLPYRRDSYFCFRQEAKQAGFLSILSDCIRHQNQDFLKKTTCEVQAFVKAVQLMRQDQGQYESWDMLIGSDVRVMSNLVMEQLLPSLQNDLLPRLKVKKMERKRIWFATVEAVYILVQEQLLQGLSALKEECRTSARQQEVMMHSDMDQIQNSRQQLEDKIRKRVSGPAEALYSDSVQPYLASMLEELMEPISSGFQEGRWLSESAMDQVCQDVQAGGISDELKKSVCSMLRLNLLSCYQKIDELQEKTQQLQCFSFPIKEAIQKAQIDLQQVTENATYMFVQLFQTVIQENPENAVSAVEKAKHRVLKQYDYDSSMVRKRIFQENLRSITLPFIKRNLKSIRDDLQDLEQLIEVDHSDFIHVENVYEGILQQMLDKEISKVVKEAVSMKKYNLCADSRDVLNLSSRSSLSSPSASTPGSPVLLLATAAQPSPPTLDNPVTLDPQETTNKLESELQSEPAANAMVTEMPLGKVEEKESSPSVIQKEVSALKNNTNVSQTEMPEDEEPAASTDPEKVKELLTEQEVTSAEMVKGEMAAETLKKEILEGPENDLSMLPATLETEKGKTEEPGPAAQNKDPAGSPAAEQKHEGCSVNMSAQVTGLQTASNTEGGAEEQTQNAEVKLEVPASGEACVQTDEDCSLKANLKEAETEHVTVSDPPSLNMSAGSELALSDVDEETKALKSSEDEVSTTSDVLEEEGHVSQSPESSDDPEAQDECAVIPSDNPSPQTQSEDVSRHVGVGRDVEADTTVNTDSSVEATETKTSAPAEQAPPLNPEAPDSIKEIRDLVVEVIEVEELVQRYPSGLPKDE
ncbi:hypothetical protein LDENG_00146050 [Lucifuga dentata]|nr:hypothetical protein LDENG_00146050 [Lucifuga dentata]